MSMIWPIVLIVFSNVIYQICAKEVPENIDAMASMTITYIVGAVCSAVIYAYKNGWAVSTVSLVQSAFLAVVLIVVGGVLYHEAITLNKVVGIALCLIGLYFIKK